MHALLMTLALSAVPIDLPDCRPGLRTCRQPAATSAPANGWTGLRLNDVQAPCPGVVIYGAKQSSEAFRRDMEAARAEMRAAGPAGAGGERDTSMKFG